jgi:hypothetical protein
LTLTLAKISAHNAHALLARELGGSFGDISLRRSLAADHIRSALYASASLAIEQNVSPTLHTLRLLTSVRKTLDLLWAGTATEHLRNFRVKGDAAQQTLDSLKEFGDIVDTGGGYWLGTPPRIVRSGDTCLAIGAAPNAVLKALSGAAPICAGISRFVELRSKESAEQTISISEWLGSAQDIQSWTKDLLSQHEQRMQSGNDISADQLEIFAPDLLSRTQKNPWIPAQAISRPLAGARLCRPVKTVAYVWDRPFYLIHFRFSAGELLVARSVRVDYSLTRRLRFGLSKLYGNSQTVTGTTSRELVELEMPVALPDPEERITALGWPVPSNPRRVVFHRLAIPFLTEVMGRLAVPVIAKLGP